MEDLLKTLNKEDLLKLSAGVINFIIDEIDGCNQKILAKELGVSTATINVMAKANMENCSASTRFLRKTLTRLLIHYTVELDISTNRPISIKKPNQGKAKDGEESFFTQPYGNKWRLMIHINQWGRAKERVVLRYLIIHAKDEVELLVGSDKHDDYKGAVRVNLGGKQAVFELVTKNKAVKEVYIRFAIGNSFARPSYIEGFLIHSHIDDNSISGYTIIAQNISGTSDPMTPREMSFSQFKKYNAVIADFFRLKSTAIHCHSGIFNLDDVKLAVEAEKKAYRE